MKPLLPIACLLACLPHFQAPIAATNSTNSNEPFVVKQASGAPAIRVSGVITPYKTVQLKARTAGRVEYLAGIEGDAFRTGVILVAFSDVDLLSEWRALTAQLTLSPTSAAERHLTTASLSALLYPVSPAQEIGLAHAPIPQVVSIGPSAILGILRQIVLDPSATKVDSVVDPMYWVRVNPLVPAGHLLLWPFGHSSDPRTIIREFAAIAPFGAPSVNAGQEKESQSAFPSPATPYLAREPQYMQALSKHCQYYPVSDLCLRSIALAERQQSRRYAAPFEGIIIRKNINVGDEVTVGQLLLEFADVEYLQIDAEIPARLRVGLREGMMTTATLDPSDRRVPVRVAQIFPSADLVS